MLAGQVLIFKDGVSIGDIIPLKYLTQYTMIVEGHVQQFKTPQFTTGVAATL
jgi:hypothetical protein